MAFGEQLQTMGKIRLPAEMKNLEELLGFVVKEAEKAGFTAKRVSEIRLAAEEVLVNIFSYAYSETGGHVSISCSLKEGLFVLEFLDGGVPFDIMAVPGPDVSSCLSERHVGGLGILFVKEMATETRYLRDKARNRLTLVFAKCRNNH